MNEGGKQKFKLAILTTHPIQFQAPLFRRIAEEADIDLTVYFCWDFGVKETYDAEFKTSFKWDIPLLDGYKSVFLKNWAGRPGSDRFFGCINPGIIPEIFQGRYDAFLVLGWQVFSMYLSILTGFFSRTPVFLRGENPLNQEVFKPRWKRLIKKLILGTIFRGVRRFFYISEENKKFYLYHGVPASKLIFMPYATDNAWHIAEYSRLAPRRTELRRELLGFDDDRPVILFSGKLVEKKRPLDLLKAYERFSKKHPDRPSALVYLGDGELRQEIEKYADEHGLKGVRITGFKNQSQIPNYYALADVYVQASGVGDTAPFTVNEAMCYKLPILMSDRIGTALDRVKQGENGYVFPYGDFGKIAEYLEELLQDPEKRRRFGEKSLELIKQCSYEEDVLALKRGLNALQVKSK